MEMPLLQLGGATQREDRASRRQGSLLPQCSAKQPEGRQLSSCECFPGSKQRRRTTSGAGTDPNSQGTLRLPYSQPRPEATSITTDARNKHLHCLQLPAYPNYPGKRDPGFRMLPGGAIIATRMAEWQQCILALCWPHFPEVSLIEQRASSS